MNTPQKKARSVAINHQLYGAKMKQAAFLPLLANLINAVNQRISFFKVVLFVMGVSATAVAGDIDFNFEIPTIPFPPQISDVQNEPPCVSNADFEVSATIVGQEQKKAVCDVVPREDCEAEDWYMIADAGVTPNPPAIAMARVYYYVDGDPSATSHVDMAREGDTDTWKADVTLTGVEANSVITYYIAAVDTRGNVASQVPDRNEIPAPDIQSWDATLSTPGLDSCSYATSYSQCNENILSHAGSCGSEYTLADRQGDVCGEPDGAGNQYLISGTNADKVDMLGISVGADSSMVGVKMGLGAPPPGPTDSPPIEGYLVIFFNPDLDDPQPADTHITNAYAVTYAPEAMGSDPTLVKDLWEADCVSNPNVTDPLGCRLIVAVGDDPNLKIGYQSGSLRVLVRKQGTGTASLNNSFSLIGSESNQSVLVGLTGEINLSGGNAFWISDLTPGFAFYHENQNATVTDTCPQLPCVDITTTTCNNGESTSSTGVCTHSTSAPAQNSCAIGFVDTGNVSGVTEYRLYRSPKGGDVGSTPVATSLSASTLTDNISTLEGQAYDYYVACWNGIEESDLFAYAQTHTECTVDDWTAPQAPAISTAETPEGSDGVCKVSWTADGSDPTLKDFLVKRDGDVQNAASPVNKVGSSYSWPDPEKLDYSTDYTYSVMARDKVQNMSESTEATCRPRDRKAPCQVDTIVATGAPTPMTLGVTLDWSACEDLDTAGYNVYFCRFDSMQSNCTTPGEFSQLNSSMIDSVHFENEDPPNFPEEDWYRFYVESCDDCTDRNACEEKNCSGFPLGTDAFKDHYVNAEIILTKPDAPSSPVASEPEMGRSCSLAWNRVCSDEEGPFDDCDEPTATELVGYKIVRQTSPNVPDPVSGTVVATVAAGGISETVSYTDPDLSNGVTYYYKIYAMNGSRNYSPGSNEVDCTPVRTRKPSIPELQTPTSDGMTCALDWNAVDDPDPMYYDVHRCDNKMSECDQAAKFSPVDGAGNLTATQFTDYAVMEAEYYTYCIASDAEADLSSDVYNASNTKNCGQCFVGDDVAPPTDVSAWFDEGDYSVKMTFTRSVDDDGSGGYKVYRCSDMHCTSGAATVKTCSELLAGGGAISNLSELTPISISGEPEGNFYYGATYQKGCSGSSIPSILEYTSTAISEQIDVKKRACSNAAKCVVISSCANYETKSMCTPLTRKDTTQIDDNGYVLTPQQGFEVYLADSSGAPIPGASTTTGADGNYVLMVDTSETALNLSDKYRVVLKIPHGEAPGQPCSGELPGDGCLVSLQKGVTLTEDSAVKKVNAPNLAECGGGEIGNFNCDATVDIMDIALLKNCYGSAKGDSKYQTWCDVNGDGIVDIMDLASIRSYYGLALESAPSCRADLCRPSE